AVHYDEHGTPAAVIEVSHDMTDRKLIQEKLAFQARELERSNTDLAQFSHVVSHDLQAPLRSIKSYAELLDRRYRNQIDGDAQDFLHFMVDGVDRMEQLIRALLDYAQVQQTPSHITPVDATEILHEVLTNLRPLIEETHAKLESDPPPGGT